MIHPLRNLLVALLEQTNGKQATKEGLLSSIRMTKEAYIEIMGPLEAEGLVTVSGDSIELSVEQRLGIAVKAVEAGADFERVSRSLGWLEFEEMAAHVFEENGFKALRRFRFQAEGRRWEMDVLASRRPHIICAECKCWTRGMGNSQARGIVEAHLEKTEVFSRHIGELAEKVGVHRWERATITPMALTLSPTRMQIYRRVPSVSVLALPSFLSEFEGQMERLAHFIVEMPPWKPKPRQTRLRRR